MMLRTKIALIVTLVVVAYAAIDHAAQRMVVTPRFSALEEQEARKDLDRVRFALLGELENLDARCIEWSRWEETRRFLQSCERADGAQDAAEKERFIRSNLGLQSFRNGRVNLLYVVGRDGRIHWGKGLNLESGTEFSLRQLAFESLSPSHPLLVKRASDEAPPQHLSGLISTEIGPMFVTSRPIAGEPPESPFLGSLILGRLVDDRMVARLIQRTEVQFSLWPLEGGELPETERAMLDEVTGAPEPVVRQRGDDELFVYTTLENTQRVEALLVRANVPREISKKGATAVRYSLVSTAAAGVLLLLVLLVVLRRTVLAPIGRLTQQAVEIGRTEDYGAKLGLERGDEIGILAREFDSMMGKLEKSREAVVVAARNAGMSEMATGILHNVGNVLNSVNVSAGVVTERVKASKLVKLERVVEMVQSQGDRLGEFIATDPKGKHVGPFLGEVTRLMRVEHEEIAREVDSLNAGIEHIRRLVALQQDMAGSSELREPAVIEDQVQQAITLSADALAPGSDARIVLDIEPLGRILLDKHKLILILVNLLKNARESIAVAGTKPGRIEVRARRVGERLHVQVTDDGAGIAPEDLAKVFNHGFTTKHDGHGFGLHASANAATEMDGKLTTASDGPQCGATFTLDLPFEPAPRA